MTKTTETPKKIEIELYRYNNLVFGKILSMDESLRNNLDIRFGGLRVRSREGYGPALDSTTLFVRAKEGQDDRIFNYKAESNKKAFELCSRIQGAVELINTMDSVTKEATEEELNKDGILKIG